MVKQKIGDRLPIRFPFFPVGFRGLRFLQQTGTDQSSPQAKAKKIVQEGGPKTGREARSKDPNPAVNFGHVAI
jgi:hypothetical protein